MAEIWPKGFTGAFDWISALLALAAAVSLFRYKANVIHVIAASAVIGLILQLAIPYISI